MTLPTNLSAVVLLLFLALPVVAAGSADLHLQNVYCGPRTTLREDLGPLWATDVLRIHSSYDEQCKAWFKGPQVLADDPRSCGWTCNWLWISMKDWPVPESP